MVIAAATEAMEGQVAAPMAVVVDPLGAEDGAPIPDLKAGVPPGCGRPILESRGIAAAMPVGRISAGPAPKPLVRYEDHTVVR